MPWTMPCTSWQIMEVANAFDMKRLRADVALNDLSSTAAFITNDLVLDSPLRISCFIGDNCAIDIVLEFRSLYFHNLQI